MEIMTTSHATIRSKRGVPKFCIILTGDAVLIHLKSVKKISDTVQDREIRDRYT